MDLSHLQTGDIVTIEDPVDGLSRWVIVEIERGSNRELSHDRPTVLGRRVLANGQTSLGPVSPRVVKFIQLHNIVHVKKCRRPGI